MLVSMNAYQIGEAVGSGVVIALPAIMTAGATAEAEAAGSVFEAAAVETSGETASQVGFFGRSAKGLARNLGAEAVESSQMATRSEQLAVEGGLFGEGIGAESAVYGARGSVSGRVFDEASAGGPIRNLEGTQANIKFTHKAVDVVELHTSRFGADAANQFMIKRVRSIANGEIEATSADRNFYSHELREFVRYRKLGWRTGLPQGSDMQRSLWNNTHTATLEDYGLSSQLSELYTPRAIQIMQEQEELQFKQSLNLGQ